MSEHSEIFRLLEYEQIHRYHYKHAKVQKYQKLECF